jgi:organic hydroperoxide reductase OsmC/OhrA
MDRLDKVGYTVKIDTTDCLEGGRFPPPLMPPGDLAVHSPGSGTNLEHLFTDGWSACFLSAMKIVGGKMKVLLPADLVITTSGLPIFATRRRTAKATC